MRGESKQTGLYAFVLSLLLSGYDMTRNLGLYCDFSVQWTVTWTYKLNKPLPPLIWVLSGYFITGKKKKERKKTIANHCMSLEWSTLFHGNGIMQQCVVFVIGFLYLGKYSLSSSML